MIDQHNSRDKKTSQLDYIVEEYPITDYAVFDVIPDGNVNILDVVNLIFIIIES